MEQYSNAYRVLVERLEGKETFREAETQTIGVNLRELGYSAGDLAQGGNHYRQRLGYPDL